MINRAGSSLLGDADEDTPCDRRPWRNPHRRSDPIGGPLLVVHPPGADNGDIDRQLLDPRFDRPPGDTCDPAHRGHSDYFADPAFEESAAILRELSGS